MLSKIRDLLLLPTRFHFFGGFLIVLGIASVISSQIADRSSFADGELHQDVMERWGSPIHQAAPSVRYVLSGTVFNTLRPLPLSKQQVDVKAVMNYRKRGLVYFSGYDFSFHGTYEVVNPEDKDIDVVFVFPVSLERNKALLSLLAFSVNGEAHEIELDEHADKFVWTGRMASGRTLRFDVGFRGRGLDQFVYRLDPSLPVRDFELRFGVTGGDNFDYPGGAVSAHEVVLEEGRAELFWKYPSLESGVPVGIVLPSEKSFDRLIRVMVARSWAPFLAFFVGLVFLSVHLKRKLEFYESYLFSSAYGFFYVLLAYFAAFMNFYIAYVLAFALMFVLIVGYGRGLMSKKADRWLSLLLVAFLLGPSFAVVAEGYTGLIYTIEIFVGLLLLMALTTQAGFVAVIHKTLEKDQGEYADAV